jgi:hypothetical protein
LYFRPLPQGQGSLRFGAFTVYVEQSQGDTVTQDPGRRGRGAAALCEPAIYLMKFLLFLAGLSRSGIESILSQPHRLALRAPRMKKPR